jgi:transcriptional regulator with XRE-family HTH domain
MDKSKKLKQESDSILDALRIEKTALTQHEFAMYCGIPPATYYRWITGKTEAKLTVPQMKKLCQLLQTKLEDLPDHFGPGDRP